MGKRTLGGAREGRRTSHLLGKEFSGGSLNVLSYKRRGKSSFRSTSSDEKGKGRASEKGRRHRKGGFGSYVLGREREGRREPPLRRPLETGRADQ